MNPHLSVSLVLTAATALLGAAAAGCASTSSQHPAPSTLREFYGLRKPTGLDAARTALVLVDFQEEFFHGRLPLPKGGEALRHAEQLLAWARREGLLVVHVRNVVTRPGSPLFAPESPATAIVPPLQPAEGEWVITKAGAGAFSRTELAAQLERRGIKTIIVAGLMTHLAVDTTVRDGSVLGYQVIVAAEATATRDLPGAAGGATVDHEVLQRVALASLADRFADIMTTAELTALPVQSAPTEP